MKKEELEKEVERLKEEIDTRETNQKLIREEFAKAFGWFKHEKYGLNTEPKPQTPTFGEIFIKVGRLLEIQTEWEIGKQLSEIEERLVLIGKDLDEKGDKLLNK